MFKREYIRLLVVRVINNFAALEKHGLSLLHDSLRAGSNLSVQVHIL